MKKSCHGNKDFAGYELWSNNFYNESFNHGKSFMEFIAMKQAQKDNKN